MWAVLEGRDAEKALDKAPREIVQKYEFWKSVVRQSGPVGLRALKGMHDEALSGQPKGLRSSRLSLHWRVMYRVYADLVTVEVLRVSAHDYKR